VSGSTVLPEWDSRCVFGYEVEYDIRRDVADLNLKRWFIYKV